jgi:hypothetical protein
MSEESAMVELAINDYYDGNAHVDKVIARIIAGWWHDGQGSAMYAFSSSGTITENLVSEIHRDMRESAYSADDLMQLRYLLAYVNEHN